LQLTNWLYQLANKGIIKIFFIILLLTAILTQGCGNDKKVIDQFTSSADTLLQKCILKLGEFLNLRASLKTHVDINY
jgi:hypothetical protein